MIHPTSVRCGAALEIIRIAHLTVLSSLQIPLAGFCRRHVQLFVGHDIRRRRHPRALQQDDPAVLHTAGRQLPVFCAAAVSLHPVSATSAAEIRSRDRPRQLQPNVVQGGGFGRDWKTSFCDIQDVATHKVGEVKRRRHHLQQLHSHQLLHSFHRRHSREDFERLLADLSDSLLGGGVRYSLSDGAVLLWVVEQFNKLQKSPKYPEQKDFYEIWCFDMNVYQQKLIQEAICNPN